jgi:hypothetical protein
MGAYETGRASSATGYLPIEEMAGFRFASGRSGKEVWPGWSSSGHWQNSVCISYLRWFCKEHSYEHQRFTTLAEPH